MHCDAWNVPSATRLVSVVIYLNTVKEGGETIFPNLDLKVAPKRGRMLFFPSSFVYPHKAVTPISSVKYAIVTWLCLEGTPEQVQHYYMTFPY